MRTTAHVPATPCNTLRLRSAASALLLKWLVVAQNNASGASTAETVATPTPTTTSQAEGKSYGLAGIYAAGPLVAGIVYDEVTKPGVGTYLSGYSPITGGAVSGYAFGNGSDNVKVWAAGASYDFTVVKASIAYSSLTDVK